jgi:hypothetical protein
MDILSSPPYVREGNPQTNCPGRLSMLDDLIYYWTQELPKVFNPSRPCLHSLSYFPLKIAAAEWMNFSNYMRYSIENYEYSLGSISTTLTSLTDLQYDLRYIHS